MNSELGATIPPSNDGFLLSFSDEFDEAKFDLNGKNFKLRQVGNGSRAVSQWKGRYYEFAFEAAPIRDRTGAPLIGNLFIVLSSPLETSDGPWGARVLALDASDSAVPIGRASLSRSA
jgi:hypothetical protein